MWSTFLILTLFFVGHLHNGIWMQHTTPLPSLLNPSKEHTRTPPPPKPITEPPKQQCNPKNLCKIPTILPITEAPLFARPKNCQKRPPPNLLLLLLLKPFGDSSDAQIRHKLLSFRTRLVNGIQWQLLYSIKINNLDNSVKMSLRN